MKRFTERGAPGAYLRVITPGSVGAGDAITVLHRPDARRDDRDDVPSADDREGAAAAARGRRRCASRIPPAAPGSLTRRSRTPTRAGPRRDCATSGKQAELRIRFASPLHVQTAPVRPHRSGRGGGRRRSSGRWPRPHVSRSRRRGPPRPRAPSAPAVHACVCFDMNVARSVVSFWTPVADAVGRAVDPRPRRHPRRPGHRRDPLGEAARPRARAGEPDQGADIAGRARELQLPARRSPSRPTRLGSRQPTRSWA